MSQVGKNRTLYSVVCLAIICAAAACKSSSSAPKPKPAAGATTGGDPGEGETVGSDPGEGESSAGETPTGETEEISIAPADSSEDFKYTAGSSVSIDFKIDTVLAGSAVLVGLAELPDGASMSKSGKNVTFSWATAKAGTHQFQFLLRDKKACEEKSSDSDQCAISESDFGNLSKGAYDTLSESYTLTVSEDGTTSNTGSGGSGSGNAQLIQQIIGLLGGGGGTDLTQLLGGLSGGQLQQLLGLVQNGGSGLDINTLLTLVQGLTLRGEESGAAGQVETLPPKPR